MKVNVRHMALSLLVIANAFTLNANEPAKPTKDVVSFQENKGQVHDQNYNPRPDVLFSGNTNGLYYHLKHTGLSYQLLRIDEFKTVLNSKTTQPQKQVAKQTIYRIDIDWLNANPLAQVVKSNELEGSENFYSDVCPNGIADVKSYQQVVYKNIYSGTDLKWYNKDGSLEYDFIVNPGADYHNINMKINGADKIRINTKGELEIITPLGTIIEKAPIAYQGNLRIEAQWKLNDQVVSFEIGQYDKNLPLIIDPSIRVWGTYYGSSAADHSNEVCYDNSGNVIIAGYSNSASAIATTGAHQVTIGGSYDAFVAKFNSSGVRQWGTYYGGSGDDYGYSCASDASGNIIMVGNTTSSGTVIATSGSHDAVYSGNQDAFLVKFNASGVRQWGTFYGDIGSDSGNDCAIDNSGNIYLIGTTADSYSTTISTTGCHQLNIGGGTNVPDAYLVKFNISGVRQWGTFYGGTGGDTGLGCFVEPSGGVFITGNAASNTGTIIATPGSHQPTHGGGTNDAYLAYFNTSGVRQWGTYYGATGNDFGTCCVKDGAGFVYMGGYTSSGSAIATAGAHQTTHGGGTNDGILVKFNSSGVRQWGTYYGGSANDYVNSVTTNTINNKVYIAGQTASAGGIATNNAFQTTWGAGLNDAYMVSFIPNGVRQSATYYSAAGNYDDQATGCVSDASGNLYMTGLTTSPTALATPGAHQTTFGGFGAMDGFLVKFQDCSSTFSTALTSTVVCPGQNVDLTTSSAGVTSYSWNTGATTSSISVSPTITTNYTVTANTATAQCFYTKILTVSVTPGPTLNITGTNTVCAGVSTTLFASGANTYSWSTGATTSSVSVTPTITTTYSVTGTSTATGCSSVMTRTVNVNPAPSVTITASSPTICSGSTVLLTASGATSYFWSTGNMTNTILIVPSTTTGYTVTGTAAGCSSVQTITIGVTPTPTVNITSGTNTICTGSTATLTATGATTYSWNTSATTNSISVSPTVTTTYTVVGYNGACSRTRTITITNNTPNLNVSATSTAICTGGSSTLTAAGATTYSWNTGATTPAINVSPTGNTTYTVIGTTGACTSTSVISVNVTSAISMNIASTMSVSCSGAPVILTASGASTYTWSTGPNTTTISVTPTVSTNYTVSGTSGSCSGSTVITIDAGTNPTINSVTSQSLICTLPVQQSATLTASGATTYSWNTGATTAAITVSPGITTTYTVTGYNAQGCMNTSVITQSVSTCTGINEASNVNNETVIYPNPSNGSFNIRTAVGGKFEIVNQLGQIVYMFEKEEGVEENIQINSLEDGIYYLYNSKEKIHKKIIITKQ